MPEWITVTSSGLVCPYTRCGRAFEQPVLVTDGSKLPRETYYACPHCMLRLELSMEPDGKDGLGHVHVKTFNDGGLLSELEAGDKGRQFGEAVSHPQYTRPSKTCRHFLGYLRSLPRGRALPDECTVCPNVVQCYLRRE
jgi:hypothetical protein